MWETGQFRDTSPKEIDRRRKIFGLESQSESLHRLMKHLDWVAAPAAAVGE
jgi:hypothetical protein